MALIFIKKTGKLYKLIPRCFITAASAYREFNPTFLAILSASFDNVYFTSLNVFINTIGHWEPKIKFLDNFLKK